ncbi:MAG TPA: SDR family NAD(P)-dependent oxidoreductase [Burkholderiales bacterium]|nr:SDR family NAD(P)-dependent oxidoreductase [Burkholderiales bacterium]
MSLAGRTALITGAGGGIGSAVARAFAAAGADLSLADLQPVAVLAAEVKATGRRVLDTRCDVTQSHEVKALINATLESLGKIDVLVNVAGTVSFGPAATLAEAEWERVLAVNLKGTFLCCQAVIAPMRAQKYGRIINIGSILGKNGGNARPWLDAGEQAQASNVAYGVSKAGVHAMTMFLARELAAAGITVNAVAPGPIASKMTENFPQRLRNLIPVGRMGTADEVARACLFLADESSGYITAEILDVNGGMWGD